VKIGPIHAILSYALKNLLAMYSFMTRSEWKDRGTNLLFVTSLPTL